MNDSKNFSKAMNQTYFEWYAFDDIVVRIVLTAILRNQVSAAVVSMNGTEDIVKFQYC